MSFESCILGGQCFASFEHPQIGLERLSGIRRVLGVDELGDVRDIDETGDVCDVDEVGEVRDVDELGDVRDVDEVGEVGEVGTT